MDYDLSSDGFATTRPLAESRLIGEESLWMTPPTSAGIYVNGRTALESTALLAAFNTISTDVASLPLDVYRRMPGGGRRNATEHPVDEILTRSPDGESTPFRWRQALQGHALSHGNGYAEIERVGRGRPYKLHLLDPMTTRVERQGGRDEGPLGYRIDRGKWLPAADVLHVAGLGYDGLCGYDFVRLIRNAIGLGAAAESYGADYFANGAEPNGYIKVPNKLTPAAQAETRSGWHGIHGGLGNRHRTGILSGGADYVSTSLDPEKSQLVEVRKFQFLEQLRPWRVPPHKAGDFSQAHLANIEASNLDYLQTALMPWLKAWEQECNLKLFSRAEWQQGYYVEHNVNALLRGDIASRFSAYEIATRNGWMSRDEVRQRENDNPIGPAGGGAIYTVQSQNIPLDQVGKEPPPAPPPVGTRAIGNGQARYNPYHAADGKFAGHAGHKHNIPDKRKPAPAGGGGGASAPAAAAAVAPAAKAAPPPPEPGKDLAGATPKEVDAYHKSMSGDYAGKLTEKEKGATNAYSTSLYGPMNTALRTGKAPPGYDTKSMDNLSDSVSSGLAKASLKEPVTVYRGIKNLESLGLSEANLTGATIRDKGFMSTSLTTKVAENFAGDSKGSALLRITAPAGTRGASIAGIGAKHNAKEKEVLFDRGGRLTITGHSRDARGRLTIEATISHD